ncbi:hypothetical protein BH10CYA1_BH10CYA1_09060 [soil metagenome]
MIGSQSGRSMSISNRSSRALIASGLLLGSLSNPMQVDARRWQEYLHTGTNIVRQGIQIRNSASGGGYESGGGGGGGSYQQPPAQQAPEAHSAPNSPGSNYYNIDPSTMRNPNRRAPEPPPEQPAYTAPSQRPYTSRSAYHTGLDTGAESQQGNNRIPSYGKRPMHAHGIVKRVDRPEKAAVVVDRPTSKSLFFEKPEIKPATTFDTSWIMPAFDRIEAKLHKG